MTEIPLDLLQTHFQRPPSADYARLMKIPGGRIGPGSTLLENTFSRATDFYTHPLARHVDQAISAQNLSVST